MGCGCNKRTVSVPAKRQVIKRVKTTPAPPVRRTYKRDAK